jgi:hypothetical protein
LTKADLSIRIKRTQQNTGNQIAPHKTANNETPHSDDEIKENHLFILKKRKESDYMPKIPKITPPHENGEKKKLKEGDLGPAEKRKKVKKN